MSDTSHSNILVIIILGGLAFYCLYLDAGEMASFCAGALAGYLKQRTTPPDTQPPRGDTP